MSEVILVWQACHIVTYLIICLNWSRTLWVILNIPRSGVWFILWITLKVQVEWKN